MAEEKKKNIYEIDKCPECGSSQLVRDYERGELVCSNCGLVIDDSYIDEGPSGEHSIQSRVKVEQEQVLQ